MPTSMNCPNCGAAISVQDGVASLQCPYCNTTVTFSGNTNDALSMALGALGNMPGMNELMGKAMQLKHVKELIEAGNKLEAIKIYREITGLGLKEAKEAVEAMEAGRPVMLNNGAQVFSQTTTAMDPNVLAQIQSLIKSGNKIEAIKRYRETSGLGLKEAKDVIDALAAGQPVTLTTAQAVTQTSLGSDNDFVDEIKNLLARNKKIDAIKIYRARYNVGLKEAKDSVEALEIGVLPQQTPMIQQQTPSVQQPKFASSEPVISENPFDRDEKKASGCNWIAVGIGLFALLLIGACVALGLYLGIFNQLLGG